MRPGPRAASWSQARLRNLGLISGLGQTGACPGPARLAMDPAGGGSAMRGGDEQSLEGVWHKGPGLGRMQCSQRDGHCGWGPWCQPSSCWKPPASNAAAPLAYLLQSPTPPRLSRTCSRLQRCRASRVLDSPPTRDNQPRHSVVHEGQPTASFSCPRGTTNSEIGRAHV